MAHAKPPAFQFYADDFLGGTMTMTLEERGLYITLLCLQWTQGSVSDDDIKRLGSAMAQPSVCHVRSKFEQGPDSKFRNARLESVRAKQDEFRANRSLSGKEGARTRWHSHSTANGSAIAQPMAKHSSPSPSPSPKEQTAPKVPRVPTMETWLAYCAERYPNWPRSDAQAAWEHYESLGWKKGKTLIAKWKLCVSTCFRNRDERRNSGRPEPQLREVGL